MVSSSAISILCGGYVRYKNIQYYHYYHYLCNFLNQTL